MTKWLVRTVSGVTHTVEASRVSINEFMQGFEYVFYRDEEIKTREPIVKCKGKGNCKVEAVVDQWGYPQMKDVIILRSQVVALFPKATTVSIIREAETTN